MPKINKVQIIAEVGVNHNGSIAIAKKLIDIASKAGADFVKFQTFKTESLVTQHAKKAFYQNKSHSKNNNQFNMLKKLEFNNKQFKILLNYCKFKKIKFLSTPFDIDSIKLLDDLKLKYFKIASGEITNLPYLIEIAKLNKKIFLSTGMSSIEEIEKTLKILTKFGTPKKNITLLHCNSEYPTPDSDANLRAINTMEKKFKINIGYSDHTLGNEASILAVSLGATVIEKHLTLNKNMKGPDHSSSSNPSEFQQLVKSINKVQILFGTGIKKPSKSEKKNIIAIRKSIVAISNIKKGEKFSNLNIGVKRPGGGISPMKFFDILGCKSNKNYKNGDLIKC